MHLRLKKKKKTNELYLGGAVSVCYSTRAKRACLEWVTVGFFRRSVPFLSTCHTGVKKFCYKEYFSYVLGFFAAALAHKFRYIDALFCFQVIVD